MEEKMLKKAAFILVILSFILAGCAASRSSAPMEAPNVATEREGVKSLSGGLPSAEDSAYAADQSATTVDRLVIKNATLSIVVDDPLKSKDNITFMAEAMGGYVVSADVYQQTLNNGAKVPQVAMTIRVPAEKLDEALATIKNETTQPILSENETSQDVTADYTDLNSRLVNLQAAEAQLQKIMDSAVKTEDVLAVYSQLVSVREQIEVIKGQMQYYERSAALSSISIQLTANAAMQPITIAGWQPKGVANEALQSLIHALQSLASFGIRAGILYIPVLLVIFVPLGLIAWGIYALIKKARRPKVALTSSPE